MAEIGLRLPILISEDKKMNIKPKIIFISTPLNRALPEYWQMGPALWTIKFTAGRKDLT
jgi:hypothetical protein